jgi:hypothetical protein
VRSTIFARVGVGFENKKTLFEGGRKGKMHFYRKFSGCDFSGKSLILKEFSRYRGDFAQGGAKK